MGPSKKRTRTFRTQSQWQSLIDKQARSCQTIETFCKDQSLSVSAFYRWRQLLSSSISDDVSIQYSTDKNTKPFFEITAPKPGTESINTESSSQSQWCVELQIGDHMVLRVRA